MQTLEWLLAEFEGKTTVQQTEHLKQTIGAEVEIAGIIDNIDATNIHLRTGGLADESPLLVAPDERTAVKMPFGTLIFISYDTDRLGAQLLTCSTNDGVRLATRLTGADFAHYGPRYDFTLVSIVRLNTHDERQKARQGEQKQSGCFVATAAFGEYDSNVAVLQNYRDRVLSRSSVGRCLVHVYYRVSPGMARFIQASASRRSITRIALKPFVFLAHRQLERAPRPDFQK